MKRGKINNNIIPAGMIMRPFACNYHINQATSKKVSYPQRNEASLFSRKAISCLEPCKHNLYSIDIK